MTRVITSGVGSTTVLDPPIKYTVVDVGGQRNERRKWLHCFDDVKVVVFLISLAGYNQVREKKKGKSPEQEQKPGNAIRNDLAKSSENEVDRSLPSALRLPAPPASPPPTPNLGTSQRVRPHTNFRDYSRHGYFFISVNRFSRSTPIENRTHKKRVER